MPIDFSKLDRDRLSYLINVPSRNRTLLLDKTSQYDKGFIIPEGEPEDVYSAYYENLAQTQPWYDKLANSAAKGTVLAGTTFVDTFAGTAAGLINMAAVAAKEGDQSASEIFNAFITNPVSVALNDLNEMIDSDVLVNYRTKREIDNAWYENAIGMGGASGLANFWGESVLKNAGFMVGGAYAGKGIAALGSRLARLETGRKEFQTIKKAAEKVLSGVDLPNKSVATLINTFKNHPELYTIESAQVMKDLEIASRLTRQKEFGIQMAASTLGSLGEARVEALGNGNAYRKEREKEIEQAYKSGKLNELEYQEALARIDKETMAYQNGSFLFNSLLLSASNYSGLRNAYLRPYDHAIKNRVGEVAKITEGAEKGLYKYVAPTKKELAGKSALNALRESQEEQLQFVIDKAVGSFVRTNQNGENIKSVFEAIGDGMSEAYGSEEGWENAVIGGLFGAVGIPGLGGGAISEYRDLVSRKKEEQEIVNKLNTLIKENKLEDKSQHLLKGILKDFNLKNKTNTAIDNDDQYTYEEAKDEKFFAIANAFIEAGKVEDLIDLYQEEANLPIEELKKKYTYKDEKGVERSIFENRNETEVKDYMLSKTSNAINEIKKLRDLKDNLSTLYRNELIVVKNEEGKDMEVKVKDFLTEQLYMSEARDKRAIKLRNEILNEVRENLPDDLRAELANDQDFSEFFDELGYLNTAKLINFIDEKISKKFGKERVEDIKKASKEVKDALEREDKTFNKLVEILDKFDKSTLGLEISEEGKVIRDKNSERIGGLLSDYVKLLGEKVMSNFYLTQLSNNNFSKLIQELKKAEKEVAEEVAKNAQKNVDDDDKYNELINQAKEQGYDLNSDLVYFELNDELYIATKDSENNFTIKNVFSDEPFTLNNLNSEGEVINSYTPNIFDKSFLIKNYNKFKFVSVKDAQTKIKQQELIDNINALSNAANEQVKIVKEKINETNQQIEEWKKQKKDLTTESNILLEDIKNTAYNRNYTEKRKQWKKQLKNLQNEINKIDNEINKLNEFKSELQSQIEGLIALKDNIEKLKTIVDFTEITNIISDAILEKEINAELIGKSLDTIELLDDIILQLEDEKRYIQKAVDQLEEILLASDTTIKSHYVIMDATFRNKWVNEVGLNYLLNNNGKSTREDFIKNFPTIKRKLRQYSERVGITLKEAFDEFDNELNELKKLEKRYQDQYELENLLLTNKQDLDRVSNALEDLYKRYDKAIENDLLNKKYNALNKNLESLNKLYTEALIKINKSKKVDDTQFGEEELDDPISIDDNILSSEVFYTTGRDANNFKINGIYEDILNEEGLPELNSDPAALAFMKFINTYYGNFNNNDINDIYALQVFKYNPETAPQAVKNQIGDKTTDVDYYVKLIDKKTGNPVYVNSEGILNAKDSNIPLFRFIPKTNNLLSLKNKSKINKEGLYSFLAKKDYRISIVENQDGTKSYNLKNKNTNVEETYSTEDALLDKIIELTKGYHTDFINEINKLLSENKNVYLKIGGVNVGINVYKKNNVTKKKEYSDLLDILKKSRNITINNEGKLEGAEIIVFASDSVRLPDGRLISGKPGQFLVYINSTGEIIPSFTKNLADDDIFTILNLLNSVKDFDNLSNVKYQLPSGEFITVGDRYLSNLNLFGIGAEYSIMGGLTYWGKSKNGSSKDIYIDKGKVFFGNENISINDVLNPEKNRNLIDFLRTKKYNVSQTHLVNEGAYYHPVIENNKLTFQKYNSYTEYLLTNNILTTPIASSNKNNYSPNLIFLSRNLIFELDNNGNPIITTSLKSEETENPLTSKLKIKVNNKEYEIIDQFSPTSPTIENFEYKNIKNKYISITYTGGNGLIHIFKINEDGLLEPVDSNFNKDFLNEVADTFNKSVMDIEQIKTPEDRLLYFAEVLFTRGDTFIINPIDVDINDPQDVEEKKQECEGTGSTKSGESDNTTSTNNNSSKNDKDIEDDFLGSSNSNDPFDDVPF